MAQLCQMLRYTASVSTLRFDVLSREGAEAIARELPNNHSLMHITMGGPVPEGILIQMSEILASNTVRHLSSASPGGLGWAGCSLCCCKPPFTLFITLMHITFHCPLLCCTSPFTVHYFVASHLSLSLLQSLP